MDAVVDRVGNHVDWFESAVLGVELMKILAKLRDVLRSGFVRRMEEYGFWRAREVAEQVVVWGSEAAVRQASNMGFVRYLKVLDVNWPTGFGV